MCDYVDATMFANASVDDLSELYKKHGIKDYGYVPMYNG
jgi:DNA-directed RNA polymerase beta subunit